MASSCKERQSYHKETPTKMKNIFTTLLVFFCTSLANAQWKTETIDNGFDPPFRVAYTNDGQSKFLKLTKFSDSSVMLTMYEGYVCEERPVVELSFKMDTGWAKFAVYGLTSTDSKKVYISTDVVNSFGDAFSKASVLRIRLNDGHCGTNMSEFNMTGSAAALKFIMRE